MEVWLSYPSAVRRMVCGTAAVIGLALVASFFVSGVPEGALDDASSRVIAGR